MSDIEHATVMIVMAAIALAVTTYCCSTGSVGARFVLLALMAAMLIVGECGRSSNGR